MLIDDVEIRLQAGRGGKGGVGFNRIKMMRGPTGSNGGHGGSVYIEGISNLNGLAQFRYKKELAAEDGENGKTHLHDGRAGKDLILQVPVGTVVHRIATRTRSAKVEEITAIGQRILVARGGQGGRGNYQFRSSTNTTPREFEPGTPGEGGTFRLELKLIADVGFIGFPNAGKTSLLNELTAANSKVANYPFTTLEPNLGVYHDLVLADIPGLIEGASEGKGLGTKFLRHIERTRTLFHLISAESEDVVADYKAVRKELAAYSTDLAAKEEYVFVSKSDTVTPAELKKKLTALKKAKVTAASFSILDDESMTVIHTALNSVAKQKSAV